MKIVNSIYKMQPYLDAQKAHETADELRKQIKDADDVARKAFTSFETFNNAAGIHENPKAELRNPGKLALRVTDRLIKDDITPKTWDARNPVVRKDMLRAALNTMLEEMEVPKEIRDSVKLNIHSDDDYCSTFIRQGANGGFELNPKVQPIILLNNNSIFSDSCEKALDSLYRQAMRIMQQASSLEAQGTIADAAGRAAWEKDLASGITAHESPAMQAFTNSMSAGFVNNYNSMLKAHAHRGSQISFTNSKGVTRISDLPKETPARGKTISFTNSKGSSLKGVPVSEVPARSKLDMHDFKD